MMSAYGNLKRKIALAACALAMSACQSVHPSSGTLAASGVNSADNGDQSLEFTCDTPQNVDAAFKILAIKTMDPNAAVLMQIFPNGTKQTFNVSRRVTPPGADESITHRYTATAASLVVSVDPDPVPVAGKTYNGRWNAEQNLKCQAHRSGPTHNPAADQGSGAGSGDAALEFSCLTPENADAAFKVLVIRAMSPNSVELQQIFPNGTTTRSHADRRVTLPGADERITYKYTSPSVSLIVTVDPDPVPVVGKNYDGRWNGEQDVTCQAWSNGQAPNPAAD